MTLAWTSSSTTYPFSLESVGEIEISCALGFSRAWNQGGDGTRSPYPTYMYYEGLKEMRLSSTCSTALVGSDASLETLGTGGTPPQIVVACPLVSLAQRVRSANGFQHNTPFKTRQTATRMVPHNSRRATAHAILGVWKVLAVHTDGPVSGVTGCTFRSYSQTQGLLSAGLVCVSWRGISLRPPSISS